MENLGGPWVGAQYRLVLELPDPDWYLDNVLVDAVPGSYVVAPRGAVAEWRELWQGRATAPDELLRAAARQGFVLSATQLRRLGVSRETARSRVRRGRWFGAARGFVAPFALAGDSHLDRRQQHAVGCAANALARRSDAVSGRSAAVLLGLPTFSVPPLPELTAVRVVGAGSRASSHIYRAGLTSDDTSSWFGVVHTSPARTLVDLARHDRRDGIMAADAALRAGLVSRFELDRALSTAVGWPGVRQARNVLALASPLAESPLESLIRLVLHDDGFPTPELQVEIGGYRVDMLFRAQRVILEVDGLAKYTAAELRREKRREQRLRALGYRVERVTWDDVIVRWGETRVWLRAALHLPT